ncbi:cobalt-precorrin 5A hydrolase [Nitrosopumilus ureiphilus]|uniref:Precorrin-3B C(17)-methyltransferase n=1 Tax=Nitrosopumilus ureiphilus TaxID=1470067 RepID=A0A7D5M5R2_9ARCH|nr:cobalamin biosynthesis protein [Nitrosopumilus ureiphilus]QLH07826.1 precorrin-3B C(17)-methyltransferase [Nitrosopumilus ureiphilus]
MDKTSVLAITKNGVKIGENLKKIFPDWSIFAPSKFSNEGNEIVWYSEPTSEKIVELFKNSNALICLFSLGAVIRLIAPHLKDKKTDPAVIVIDDKTNFVISVLSGHIGRANELTQEIAEKLQALPVITTAADVNKTIAVDLVGREFGWKIEDDTNVTKISAHMVNEEPIGVFQEAGNKSWYKELPKNVLIYKNPEDLKQSNSKAYLIISDRIIDKELSKESVVYRPPSLVIGIGLHWDTTKETIREGIESCLDKFNLSSKSIAKLVSIKKPQDVQGLIEIGEEMKIPVEYVNREELADISAPNPSDTVKAFEGTASVSEAAAIKVSGGELIVEKQKFPPNLTIAIARILN